MKLKIKIKGILISLLTILITSTIIYITFKKQLYPVGTFIIFLTFGFLYNSIDIKKIIIINNYLIFDSFYCQKIISLDFFTNADIEMGRMGLTILIKNNKITLGKHPNIIDGLLKIISLSKKMTTKKKEYLVDEINKWMNYA